MKLTCDLCGGALVPKDDGAVCSVCGIEYGEKRIAEKEAAAQPPVKTPPQVQVNPQPPVTPQVQVAPNMTPEQDTSAEKYQKRMKKMRTTLVIIAVIVFLGIVTAQSMNQIEDMISIGTIAISITLFVFQPWKGKGGKGK